MKVIQLGPCVQPGIIHSRAAKSELKTPAFWNRGQDRGVGWGPIVVQGLC